MEKTRDASDPSGAKASALANLLPDARVVEIVGAGHSPYFEDPRSWNHAVDAFLDWLDGGCTV